MTEINYNDGQWHGWNGGKCPVHPKTIVEAGGMVQTPKMTEAGSDNLFWQNVIVFRVVKEHREPREFTLYVDKHGNAASWHGGEEMPPMGECEIIHVREVLE